MKALLLTAALSLCATTAFAQAPTVTCKASSANLSGAAKNSHMKKCEADAKKACEADSKEKKLAGAAKTSHMKKCVGDAVGT
jgi:hypothetical protein